MSPLLKITGLGLVSCIPLDYMHLCLLGIMKKIIRCMVRGTYVPNSYGSVRLSKDQIVLINQRMIVISKWICSDFARVPHDLNEFKTFKSTELRQIMIHTVYSQNNYAETLAKHFLKTFSLVYGCGNVSYNVHSIIHLANDAKKYGKLDNFSAFPYENYLQHIKKIIQPGHNSLVQLYNRIKEEHECHISNLEQPMYPSVYSHHFLGPLPRNILSESVSQYSTVILENFTIRVQNFKLCLVKNILNRNGEIFMVCLTFKNTIPLYDSPCPSTSIGIMSKSNQLYIIVVSNNDSYITVNFLVMPESVKVKKIVIIEFVDEAEITEVVPFTTFEIDTTENKKRKRIKKKHFESLIDFDIIGSDDSPDLFALNNDVLHYLKPMNANNYIHLNQQTSPTTDNEFIDNYYVNMGKMLMFIGHVVKDVVNDITEIKKSIKEIKVDIVKNQELLILLTDRANRSATQSQEKVPFRSNLKVPVSNLDDLCKLESNEEQKQILAQLLIHNGKCFDIRRTTYEMMRILMKNRVAKSLNIAGRRGKKLPFMRMDLYKILIDSVKYFFPEESVPFIKGCISDWLKQAPRQK
ncbi:hypothetical protein QTP88_011530 [Uroleucon formosanum]